MTLAEEWRGWWLEMQRMDYESCQYGKEGVKAAAQATIDKNTNTRQG